MSKIADMIIVFLFLGLNGWCQGTKPPVPPTAYAVKQGYYYSFKGPTTQASLDSLYKEIKAASPYIRSVKLFLKPENKLSEAKIIVEEESTRREYRTQFNIGVIKDIILAHNYQPLDLTVENLSGH